MHSLLKILIFIICLAKASIAFGQSYKLDFSSKDYASVKEWKNDTTWFNITNTSSDKWFILPTFYDQRFKLLYTNEPVMPGRQMRIGVTYYTEDKGKFSLEIPFYISSENEPIRLRIKGKIIDFHPQALVYCPNLDPKKPLEEDVLVLIEESKDQIEEEKEDEFLEELIVEDRELDTLNKWAFDTFVFKPNDNGGSQVVKKDTVKMESDTNVISLDKEHSDSEKFNSNYATNNLVFLIDISGSMAKEEKLEILKESMKQLVLALRPEDRISIITYATRAKVLYKASSYPNKDSLLILIDSLKADGHSYGKDGLDLAYAMARDEFILGGNNTVLLATDGKFNYKNFSENKLYKQAAKQAIKKINLSVIAFGKDKQALKFLKKLSRFGNGKYVAPYFLMNSNYALVDLIKSLSIR